MSKDMKRWNVFLPNDLLEAIKACAAKNDVAAAEVVRVACEKYLAAVRRAEAANGA